MLAQHPCMVVLACDNPECPNRGRLAVGRNEEWWGQVENAKTPILQGP